MNKFGGLTHTKRSSLKVMKYLISILQTLNYAPI